RRLWRSACFFFFSSRRRHTRFSRDWSSDVCSSDLARRRPRQQDASATGAGGVTGAVHERQLAAGLALDHGGGGAHRFHPAGGGRSEERRVGKECRCRGRASGEKKHKQYEELELTGR